MVDCDAGRGSAVFGFGFGFAVNSSVHCYLILAFGSADRITWDVGFYDMANAAGRLIGSVLPDLGYQAGGLPLCLALAGKMALASCAASRWLFCGLSGTAASWPGPPGARAHYWTFPHASRDTVGRTTAQIWNLAVPPLLRIAAGLALGTLGGALFFALSLPLPWMLGALFFTMAGAIAGWPVLGPMRLRPAIVAIIGVLLGARFTPEVLGQAGQAVVTLAILLVYLAAVAAVVVPYYRFVGRQDWITAYFAGMPGGLSEMIELGEARGANVPAIVLAHSLRIVVTIALMAFLFRVVLGHDVGSAASGAAHPLGPVDAAVLAASALLGSLAGIRLRIPAPTFLGPLVLSAAAHLTGLTTSAPPPGLVVAAQVVLGTILGCRFLGIAPVMLWTAGLLSLGATLLTLALAALAGVAMGTLAGVGLDQALLALAPGGLTEMGLIALAIHADVAFVALHHVFRILVVIVLAPVLLRLFRGSH